MPDETRETNERGEQKGEGGLIRETGGGDGPERQSRGDPVLPSSREAPHGYSIARLGRRRAPGGKGEKGVVVAIPDDSLFPMLGLPKDLCVLEASPK